MPLQLETKLEVWDSQQLGRRIRHRRRALLHRLAMNHGLGGQLDGPSSYLMKSPKNQRPDDEARQATEEFIAKYSRVQTPTHADAAKGLNLLKARTFRCGAATGCPQLFETGGFASKHRGMSRLAAIAS